MKNFDQLADIQSVEKTVAALKKNNIDAYFVQTGEEAKEKALSFIPEGAEVMDMTSVTLTTLGITDILHHSGKYKSVKNVLSKMDREKDHMEMQKIGAAHEYAIGSVHAVTENGQVMIASNSGSQLPGYAYGANRVIWIVGTQKVVTDMDEGMKRIYEYDLPLESERARKAYGVDGSNVSKVLLINKEPREGRITLIFVNELLGY